MDPVQTVSVHIYFKGNVQFWFFFATKIIIFTEASFGFGGKHFPVPAELEKRHKN